MLTRRKLLASASAVAPAVALAGCATMPSTGSVVTSVIDYIQAAVQQVAQYIPQVESIAALAASFFGPGWTAVVQIGTQAINTLIAALASLKTSASVRLRAVARRSVVIIGVVNGIPISGYR